MVTVLQGYATEEQRSVVFFWWVKEYSAKGIHKDIFIA
jgi:hypothetical protein